MLVLSRFCAGGLQVPLLAPRCRYTRVVYYAVRSRLMYRRSVDTLEGMAQDKTATTALTLPILIVISEFIFFYIYLLFLISSLFYSFCISLFLCHCHVVSSTPLVQPLHFLPHTRTQTHCLFTPFPTTCASCSAIDTERVRPPDETPPRKHSKLPAPLSPSSDATILRHPSSPTPRLFHIWEENIPWCTFNAVGFRLDGRNTAVAKWCHNA